MASLAPAPILATVLADLAHDWTMRLAQRQTTLDLDEAATLAAALRELAIAARQMSETFQRVVSERNALLAVAREDELLAAARARSGPVIPGPGADLVALVCRHRDRTTAGDPSHSDAPAPAVSSNVIDLTTMFRTSAPLGGAS